MPGPIRVIALKMVSRWYWWVMGTGLALLAAAGVLLGLSVTGVVGEETPGLVEFDASESGRSDATTSTGFSLGRDVQLTRPAPSTAQASDAPVVRLVIQKIGVDAPVVTIGVDAQGVMQSPDGPEDVGWYDFTGHPGHGGNAVFGGHVDYHDYGPAVFWELRDLRAGDTAEVRLEDGTSYTYVVVSANSYQADEAPIQEIVGPTPKESVTLITCTGTFDSGVRQYSHRLVVRAERL